MWQEMNVGVLASVVNLTNRILEYPRTIANAQRCLGSPSSSTRLKSIQSTWACSPGGVSNRISAGIERSCLRERVNSLRIVYPPEYPWALISSSSLAALRGYSFRRCLMYGLKGSSLPSQALDLT